MGRYRGLDWTRRNSLFHSVRRVMLCDAQTGVEQTASNSSRQCACSNQMFVLHILGDVISLSSFGNV